ncbi:hypothetical protein WMY93_031229 [Mugilogobius chulae]|uniref:Reticulon n=1 Tax=Mugilogobius chulae TaxID=88201 RepID=A0AAW0MNV5_9GOBI
MAAQTQTMMNEAVPPLKAEINSIITQMVVCCDKLHFALTFRWVRDARFISLLMTVITIVVWIRFGSNVGMVLVLLSQIALFSLCCLCKLPSRGQTIKELAILAAKLKDRVITLKQTLEKNKEDSWFFSWNSRWSILDELEKRMEDVVHLVSRIILVFRSEMITELNKSLHMCQKIVEKI